MEPEGPSEGPEADAEHDLQLRDIAEVLLRRWRVVAGSTVLAILAGLLVAGHRHDTYTAELVLRIRSPRTGVEARGLPSALSDQPQVATSELEVLRSTVVLQRVVDSLGLQLVPASGWIAAGAPPFEAVEITPTAAPGSFALTVSAGGVQLADSSGRSMGPRRGPGEWVQGPGFRVLIGRVLRDGAFRFAIVPRQAAAEKLQEALKISQIRATTLVRLRYAASSPSLAATVLNVVAEAYSENSIARGREE